MKEMIKVTPNNIGNLLNDKSIILFGAGITGKTVCNLLMQHGVKVIYFVDDDARKIGQKIQNVEVMSYQAFTDFCDRTEKVFVVMSSIYGKEILGRLSKIPNTYIYEMYEWYCDAIQQSSCIGGSCDQNKIKEFGENIQTLIEYMDFDEQSVKVYTNLYLYLKTRDSNYISDVCSEDEQYFIPEVLSAIKEPLEIVDAGAYEGELCRALTKLNLAVKYWYCFEADKKNYDKMLAIKDKSDLGSKQVCIDKGLWSQEKILFFSNAGTASRIVDEETECKIEVTSIDKYFKDKSYNFIKMDIEGSEFPALLGGINTIKKRRPIMAISIYHSLDDFFRIPRYLKENLDNYYYCVRHHSLIFSETILYAIPNELR